MDGGKKVRFAALNPLPFRSELDARRYTNGGNRHEQNDEDDDDEDYDDDDDDIEDDDNDIEDEDEDEDEEEEEGVECR